ncbi:hypothetical protein OHR68_30740 [Spirillospora sp. NBC_00431]
MPGPESRSRRASTGRCQAQEQEQEQGTRAVSLTAATSAARSPPVPLLRGTDAVVYLAWLLVRLTWWSFTAGRFATARPARVFRRARERRPRAMRTVPSADPRGYIGRNRAVICFTG